MNDGPAPVVVLLAMQGYLTAGDVPGLCRRAAGLVREVAADLIVCELSGSAATAATAEALARIQLAVRRLGCQVRITGCPAQLEGLLELIGLKDTISVS